MKKIVSIFIILVVILLLPYILGQFIKYQVTEEIAKLNEELSPILKQPTPIKLDYQTGWFSSTATLSINNIVFNNKINHTPYTLFKLAKIQTTTQFPANINKPVHALFGDKQPYELTTIVGFTGNTQFNAQSPALGQKTAIINNTPTTLDWQGLTFDANLGKNSIESILNIPKLIYKTATIDLSINDLHSNILVQKNIDQINASLPRISAQLSAFKIPQDNDSNKLDLYHLSLAQINLKNTSIVLAAHKFQTTFVKLADNHYLSTIEAQPISIEKNSQAFQAKFNYASTQELSSQQALVNYSGHHSLSAIKLILPQYINFIDNLSIDYSIERLPQQQLQDFLKSYIKLLTVKAKKSDEDKQAEQQSEVEQMAINLAIATIRETPKFAFRIQSNGNKGSAFFEFQAYLEKPDNSSISIKKLINNLVYRLNVNFSMKVTKNLLDSVVQLAPMGDSKRDQLKVLLQKLPMTESKDQYQTNIIFKNNMFYVNGFSDPNFIKTYLPILKEYLP